MKTTQMFIAIMMAVAAITTSCNEKEKKDPITIDLGKELNAEIERTQIADNLIMGKNDTTVSYKYTKRDSTKVGVPGTTIERWEYTRIDTEKIITIIKPNFDNYKAKRTGTIKGLMPEWEKKTKASLDKEDDIIFSGWVFETKLNNQTSLKETYQAEFEGKNFNASIRKYSALTVEELIHLIVWGEGDKNINYMIEVDLDHAKFRHE